MKYIIGNKNYLNVFMNIVGNFAYMIGLWIITIIVVRLYDYKAAGQLSVALSVSNIFIAMASYYLRNMYASDVEIKYPDEQYIMVRLITTVVSLIACAFIVPMGGYDIDVSLIILTFYLFKCMEMIADIFHGVMQRYGKLRYAGVTLTVRGLFVVIAFSVVALVKDKLIYSIIAIFMVNTIVLVVGDYRIAVRSRGKKLSWDIVSWKSSCSILRECFPLFVMGINIALMTSVPRIVFERVYSEEEMGYFSSINNIAMLISTAVACVMMPFISYFATMYSEGKIDEFRRRFGLCVAGIVIFGLICYSGTKLIGDALLKIIFGDEIGKYSFVFPPMILLSTIISLYTCINSVLTALKQYKSLMITSTFGTIVCCLLSMFMCRSYYMLGVVACQSISFIASIIVMAIITVKIIRTR